ncbi:MAG: sigma-70 family RNA polymerase sigma factor [Pseudomonadota bacterium]
MTLLGPQASANDLIDEIPHLRRFARSLTRDPNTADDLLQDCLERAIRRMHLIRERTKLRSWLFRMIYRIHLDTVAQAKRRREDSDSSVIDQMPDPSSDFELHAETRSVLALMQEHLTPEQCAALSLIAVEQLSYSEAADVLDIPMGTLMSRLHRARALLREVMKVSEDTPEKK